MDAASVPAITCLAVGNTIMGDDGIGQAILSQLHAVGPTSVYYHDGAIAGLELLGEFEDADKLLILDATAGPGAPGAVVHVAGSDIPRVIPQNVSPHQVGVMDLLAASRLLGNEPNDLALVGVVAETVDLRVGLSAAAQSGIAPAVDRARLQLEWWVAGNNGLPET